MLGDSQDARVTKTHMALSKTLTELLEKKSFQKITVNDICKSAMISRSTFYMHFEDKYRLMLFCLQTEREKLDNAAKGRDLRDFLYMVLASVYERKNVFHNFLQAEIDMELINMFKHFFHDCFSDILIKSEQQRIKLAGSVPMLAAYYASGITGMMIWWIEQKFSASIEEISNCQFNLLSDILPKES